MAKTPTPAKSRTTVQLPSTVTSTEAEWPGSKRGRQASPLAAQIAADLETMELGSVRRYDIVGDKEQKSFVNLFRSVTDKTYGPVYGVQAAYQNGAVFIRLGNRRGSGE